MDLGQASRQGTRLDKIQGVTQWAMWCHVSPLFHVSRWIIIIPPPVMDPAALASIVATSFHEDMTLIKIFP